MLWLWNRLCLGSITKNVLVTFVLVLQLHQHVMPRVTWCNSRHCLCHLGRSRTHTCLLCWFTRQYITDDLLSVLPWQTCRPTNTPPVLCFAFQQTKWVISCGRFSPSKVSQTQNWEIHRAEMSEKNWCNSGKTVDFYFHISHCSILNKLVLKESADGTRQRATLFAGGWHTDALFVSNHAQFTLCIDQFFHRCSIKLLHLTKICMKDKTCTSSDVFLCQSPGEQKNTQKHKHIACIMKCVSNFEMYSP